MSGHLTYDAITEGMSAQSEYALSQAVYESFMGVFEDRAPIHVDADFARSKGFAGAIMHGAILNGFLSHFVGMVFPGGNTVELSVDIRYLKPCYAGDRVRLTGKVAQKVDAARVVVLQVSYLNLTRSEVVANGRVQILMTA